MTTSIAGNNVGYTTAQLLDVNGGIIQRVPTSASADNFLGAAAASTLLVAWLGVADVAYNGG